MDTLLRVLMIEDSENDALLVLEKLRRGGFQAEHRRVETAGEMAAALTDASWDIVIADYVMPRFSGLEALRLMQERGLDLPFIVVSGKIGEETAVEAMRAGAHDYVMKDNLKRLIPAIRRELHEAEVRWKRKKAESRLRQALEWREAIFEGSRDAVFIADADARLADVNRAACDLTGYSRDELLTLSLPRILVEAGHRPFRSDYGRLMSGEESFREERLRRRDGREVDVEFSCRRVSVGDETYVHAVARDITDQKKMREQLHQSQKMEAVGQLAGGIAHDFNNMLSAIIGYAHLLMVKMDPNDPARHNVDQILAASERATVLTRRLLTFSRKQIINPRPLDVNDAIRTAEKLLTRLIGEDIDLHAGLSAGPLTVLADSVQIEQVLMNLCTNARDAMPDGGVLTIETRAVNLDGEFVKTHGYGAAGGYALITVSDSGMGMDETTRTKIFEPFFTTKEIGKGTGLGLSVVYGIVKQHDGYINVYSEPGKGTTFKIYLPLLQTMTAAAGKPVEKALEPLPTGTETVLLAEDDESLRELTRALLRGVGYTIIEAADGEEAVAKFRENQSTIRLAVLDVVMPKKSGKDVFDEIIKLQPDMKALFLSGYPQQFANRKGILDRNQNFVLKPVSPRDLLTKVRKALDA